MCRSNGKAGLVLEVIWAPHVGLRPELARPRDTAPLPNRLKLVDSRIGSNQVESVKSIDLTTDLYVFIDQSPFDLI